MRGDGFRPYRAGEKKKAVKRQASFFLPILEHGRKSRYNYWQEQNREIEALFLNTNEKGSVSWNQLAGGLRKGQNYNALERQV